MPEMSVELAAVLVDCLAYPPERGGEHVATARVPWSVIERGRALFAEEFPTVDLAAVRADWRERESRSRSAHQAARVAAWRETHPDENV